MTIQPKQATQTPITLAIKEGNGGKTITVSVTVKEQITVSFDANGGNVDTASKTVIPGQTYGD